MDDSSIKATPATLNASQINGNIDVTADQVLLSNHSTVDTSAGGGVNVKRSTGNITFNVNTFSATDSTISSPGFGNAPGPGVSQSGAVTIQGLQGAGTSANSVSLNNTTVDTSNSGFSVGDAGPILIRAGNITLNQTVLDARARARNGGSGGAISLLSSGSIEAVNTTITSVHEGNGGSEPSGPIELRAGDKIDLTNTGIDAFTFAFRPGTITLVSPIMSLSGSTLRVFIDEDFPAGSINLTATKAISLTNGTVLNADNGAGSNGGTIHIDGGAKFTSDHSTISAQSRLGNGGTIQVEAKKVDMTATQVTTATSGGPQTVGGTITIDANKATFNNSQVLSTATEGHGGTIGITAHKLNSIDSVIDASSQSGTNGTVTINGVIQP